MADSSNPLRTKRGKVALHFKQYLFWIFRYYILFVTFVGFYLTLDVQRVRSDDLSEKIIGGELASPGEFPWMVMITRVNSPFISCGGTLLSHRYVLTAAHCMREKTADMFIARLGALRVTAEDDGSVVHFAKRIMIHPGYRPEIRAIDIALFELQEEVQFTNQVKPIDLPDRNVNSKEIEGEIAVSSGWGSTSSGGFDLNNMLLKVSLLIHTYKECKEIFHHDFTEDMLCAGETGKDTCQGDSGGPLIRKNKNNTWFVVGVVSWGWGCGSTPGVYSSVLHALLWINYAIGTDSSVKMINGENAREGEFPWIAKICYSNGTQFCSGSLLSHRYVLTSVRCIERFYVANTTIHILLGAIRNGVEENGVLTYEVINVTKHPHYKKVQKFDVAMLLLGDDVKFSNKVRPIYLPLNDLDLDGQTVTIAGWGFTTEGIVEKSDTLLKTEIAIHPNKECNTKYNFEIGEDKICAGGSGTTSCLYDSGGPLMWMNADGVWFIVGWSCYGFCEEYPSVYTRVKDVRHWIVQMVNKQI